MADPGVAGDSAGGRGTMPPELKAALERFRTDLPAAAYTTEHGFGLLRLALVGWTEERRPLTLSGILESGSVPIFLDPDLPPDVVEFRSAEGRLMERILLVEQRKEAQCRGCGCWVDADLLDAEGFGPDCQTQDGGSRCS